MSSAERSITDCNVHSEDVKKTAALCECQCCFIQTNPRTCFRSPALNSLFVSVATIAQ